MENIQHTSQEIAAPYARSTIKAGDLVVSIGPSYGKVMTVPVELEGGNLTQGTARIAVNENNFPDYFFWAMRSMNILQQWDSLVQGATFRALNLEPLANSIVPVPPKADQQQISSFIRGVTINIDRIILGLNRESKLLEEKRSALITQAVTKGLNPDVPMKDSGIERVGEIPTHWDIKPLRHIGKCQNGISEGADFFGHGFPFVNYKDVYDNPALPPSVEGLANSSISYRMTYSVQRGDILFTRTSETIEEIGITSTCIQTIQDATFAGFLIRFRPQRDILLPEYSKFFFRSNHPRVFFTKEMNIVTRASLSQELLKRLPVLLPNLSEQKQISDYLESKTKLIDETNASINGEIEKLKEYRTALISAAVTGKIDLRGVA